MSCRVCSPDLREEKKEKWVEIKISANLLATQIKYRGGMEDGGKKENQSKMM